MLLLQEFDVIITRITRNAIITRITRNIIITRIIIIIIITRIIIIIIIITRITRNYSLMLLLQEFDVIITRIQTYKCG